MEVYYKSTYNDMPVIRPDSVRMRGNSVLFFVNGVDIYNTYIGFGVPVVVFGILIGYSIDGNLEIQQKIIDEYGSLL